MKRWILAALAAVTLSACATATPYEPASQATAGQGYAEQRLNDDRWQVRFSGNSETSRATVETYMLFRAAELTLQSGFDWFETVNRATDKQASFVATGDPWYGRYGPYWHPYWRAYRGGAWGPWGPDFSVEEVRRYEASAEIVMHHGPKPTGNPRALDAHEVIANVGPHVVRPAPKA